LRSGLRLHRSNLTRRMSRPLERSTAFRVSHSSHRHSRTGTSRRASRQCLGRSRTSPRESRCRTKPRLPEACADPDNPLIGAVVAVLAGELPGVAHAVVRSPQQCRGAGFTDPARLNSSRIDSQGAVSPSGSFATTRADTTPPSGRNLAVRKPGPASR
jgi:hypothetical protein